MGRGEPIKDAIFVSFFFLHFLLVFFFWLVNHVADEAIDGTRPSWTLSSSSY